jgi:hypothetical protein
MILAVVVVVALVVCHPAAEPVSDMCSNIAQAFTDAGDTFVDGVTN